MRYAIQGIDPAPFRRFFGQTDEALAAAGVIRMTADSKPGFPCRVTLEDADLGDELLLLNYEHLPVDTPFRSRHAIFVRDGATVAARQKRVVDVLLADPAVDFLHVHAAKRGCFLAEVRRV